MRLDLDPAGVLIIPAIIGLVEVCKDLGLPSRVAPAVAVLFGIAASLCQLYGERWVWPQYILIGVVVGLTASGLYSGTKTLVSRADPRP